VTQTAEGLYESLCQIEGWLRGHQMEAGEIKKVEGGQDRGIWISYKAKPAKIGYVYPGQGSQQVNMGWKLYGRHEWAREYDEQTGRAGLHP